MQNQKYKRENSAFYGYFYQALPGTDKDFKIYQISIFVQDGVGCFFFFTISVFYLISVLFYTAR